MSEDIHPADEEAHLLAETTAPSPDGLIEARRDLPSRSNLTLRRKPFHQKKAELQETREEERLMRKTRWSCCKRLRYHIRTWIKSKLQTIRQNISWSCRGCCSCACRLKCEIWNNSINEIEGYLGSTVSTYFNALVWLFKINLVCMVLGLSLIILPGVYLHYKNVNETTIYNRDSRCSTHDVMSGSSKLARFINSLIQLFTGNGWMENSPVFIGWYPTGRIGVFRFPYVYCMVVIAYFIMSLVFMAGNVSKLFNRSATEAIGIKPYSTLVFKLGWDYSIKSDKLAKLKRAVIAKSLKEQLAKDAELDLTRSFGQQFCVTVWRFATNISCIAAMAGFFYVLVYYGGILEKDGDSYEPAVAVRCVLIQRVNGTTTTSDFQVQLSKVWATYSASIIIATGNLIFPHFFRLAGSIECYQLQSKRVIITMVRSLVMKLVSICTILYLIYRDVQPSAAVDQEYRFFNCWENHMASKIYQLCVINYVVFWAYLLIKKLLSVVLREIFKVSPNEFDITEEILDLCYKQMIVWSVFPIAPLMTVLAVIETITVFYIKKLVVFRTIKQRFQRVVLTSQTANVVNALFILSLFAILTFYGFIMSNFRPSSNCSPFRGYDSFNQFFEELTSYFGDVQRYITSMLRSIIATIIIIVTFSLGLYYYKCLANSKDIKIKLMNERIDMEQKDKAFLLDKICKYRKMQQVAEAKTEAEAESET